MHGGEDLSDNVRFESSQLIVKPTEDTTGYHSLTWPARRLFCGVGNRLEIGVKLLQCLAIRRHNQVDFRRILRVHVLPRSLRDDVGRLRYEAPHAPVPLFVVRAQGHGGGVLGLGGERGG